MLFQDSQSAKKGFCGGLSSIGGGVSGVGGGGGGGAGGGRAGGGRGGGGDEDNRDLGTPMSRKEEIDAKHGASARGATYIER